MEKLLFITIADLGYKNKNTHTWQITSWINILNSEINFVRDFEKDYIKENILNYKNKEFIKPLLGNKLFKTITFILKHLRIYNHYSKVYGIYRKFLRYYLMEYLKNKDNEKYILIDWLGGILTDNNLDNFFIKKNIVIGVEPPTLEYINKWKIELNRWKIPNKEKILNDLTKNKEKFFNTIEKYDNLVVISEYIKNIFMKEGYQNLSLIHIPFIPKYKPIMRNYPEKFTENRPLKILFVANSGIMKGLQYLLEAVRKLIKDSYNIKLYVVGDIDNIMKLIISNFFKDLSHEYVNFLGFQKNVYNYYKIADVFVFPSLSEGLPRVCLEAMSTGLPLITTKVFPYIKNYKEGVYINSQDEYDIYEKLVELYENPELLVKFNKNLIYNKKNEFDYFVMLKNSDRIRKKLIWG